jgi:hypothetical protein
VCCITVIQARLQAVIRMTELSTGRLGEAE